MIRRLRPWLTRLYPRAWRIRYETEFTSLVEQCLHTPLDVLDILLGAVDAHLLLLSGESLNWREMNMLNKIRTAILIVFAAYIGFVVAGLTLVGLVDDSPMIALTKTDLALTVAWTTLQAGAAVALLSVVVGGLPLAVTVIRRALTGSRRSLGWLLVPVCAFLLVVAYFGFIVLVGMGQINIPGFVREVQPGTLSARQPLIVGGIDGDRCARRPRQHCGSLESGLSN